MVPRILLVCSGLDHIHRGFESFARDCFTAIHGEPEVRIELVKGSGSNGDDERSVPALRRDQALARTLGRVLGFRPLRLEALAFAFSLQPLLLRRAPDVVYLSEWDTARGLAALRALTRQRFRLLLSNGTFAVENFEHLDHVQELTPAARDLVVARGGDPRKHTVLPLGFEIDETLPSLARSEKATLRKRLGLPVDRRILISAAALNRSHKRLDYLINEVAALEQHRPFLLLLGEPDEETPGIRTLAHDRLGPGECLMLTVPAGEMAAFYRASDAFVLTSLVEAQARALVEAMSHGLPCIAHDSPIIRFAVGDHGLLTDLSRQGALTRLLHQGHAFATTDAAARERHDFVFERFSWDRLRPRYVELLTAVASGWK